MDLALLLSSGMKLLKRLSREFVTSFVNLLEEVPVEPTEEVEHVLKAWRDGVRGEGEKRPPPNLFLCGARKVNPSRLQATSF